MGDNNFTVFASIFLFVVVVAIGMAVKASNYEECRRHFSTLYCLSQASGR